MSNVSEYAISLPFRINSYGVVEDTSDQAKIWADRVAGTIGTGWGERVLRYEWGTTIYQESFATISSAEDRIKQDISTAFVKYFPLLELVSTETSWKQDTNELSISVLYKLPDSKDAVTAVGSVYIKGNQPSKEF